MIAGRTPWAILLGYLMSTATAESASALDLQQALSPSYHASVIRSEAASTYQFQSPGASYGIVAGETVCFVGRVTAFFPMTLFQDGHYFSARDYYRPAMGGEALLGAGYAFDLGDDQRAIAGVGPHLNALKLASTRYETFYHLSLGIGAEAAYTHPVGRYLGVGAFLAAAAHFADVIHESGGMRVGVFVNAGISLILRLRR